VRGGAAWGSAALLSLACVSTPGPDTYDLLITGGTIVDGTGVAGFSGDVAIRGDRIVRVSRERLPPGSARRVIQAGGLVVSPGFIDIHAHLEPLMQMPDAESHVRQGVTTAIGGPDGGSPWPLDTYLDSLERLRLGMNVGFLAGHNTVRGAVMGMAPRQASTEELARMRDMIAAALGAGAFGLSTGLRYLPGTFAHTDEVVTLARVAGDSGGVYATHLREEGLGLLEGVAEAIAIGRRARVPVVLTHHKAVGQQMWGRSVQTLAMVDSARAAGVDVSVDQYPYTATHTGISVLIPSWALADGDTAFARRVRDAALRDSILRGIVFNILNDRGGGDLRRVQFSRVRWMPELEGRTLHDWVAQRNLPPTPRSGAELVIEAQLRGGANAIYHVLDEGDVERIMRHPQTVIASDARLSRPGEGHPHPRAYGTFPRVLGRYVRERQVLTLERAIHKMTLQPARRMGLRDRGAIRAGAFADLVVLEPATVADRATYDRPHQYPVGIPWVVVNGRVVVADGAFTAERGGRVLRRSR
jgi:N-acyl-D-amino-acid deacylase